MKKKIKCNKVWWYISAIFLLPFAIVNFLGFSYWHKYEGWIEPSIIKGFFYLGISLIIYTTYKVFCKEAKMVKCTLCGDVFDEVKTQYDNCPNCDGKLIDIDEYYKEK